MPTSQVAPLSYNVPIVDPKTGNPTPYFQELIQQWLIEKGITDALAGGAIQPGTVTTSGLTVAAQRILGNKEAVSGAIEELTLSQALDLIGSAAQGDLLYRGSAGWQRLAPGTSGQFLKTNGAGNDPSWNPAGIGGVSWNLAATWTFSTNVAQIDFTGLAGANDIVVFARGITLSVAGAVSLRVSTNNGSSYFATSGDYVSPAMDTGAEVNSTSAGLWNASATAARSGMVWVTGANITGSPRPIWTTFNSGFPIRFFVADNANPINAVRLFPSGGGNITGGNIYVFTR